MSYLALYRKLRPKVFGDIIGQQHIVRILTNQLATGQVNHAYLFCGTRGTGKTSTAKILAKAINCEYPVDGSPCNRCESCLAIENARSLNVVEIDAASNNGVDNIREIREEVKYPPTDGGTKVYIVDEVHMLSTGAFNALLKTLEEPPERVIFILATTDPQKIPPTIHSRCQRLDFKRISTEEIVNAIESYMATEKIEIDEDAIRYIAGISDGAMRDALSLLDQCMAYYFDERITRQKIMAITGAVDGEVFFELTNALIHYDSAKCIRIIEDTVMTGRDITQFVSDMVGHLRNILVIGSLTETSSIDLSEDMIARLKETGKQTNKELLIHYIHVFSALHSQLKYAFNDRILLETTCIKLCNPEISDDTGNMVSRLAKLEERIEAGNFASVSPVGAGEVKTAAKPVAIREKAVPEDINKVIQNWPDFVDGFKNPLKPFLKNTFPGYLEGNILYIVANDSAMCEIIKKKEEVIKESLHKKFGKEFHLKFSVESEYNQTHEKDFGMKDKMAETIIKKELDEKLNGFFEIE